MTDLAKRIRALRDALQRDTSVGAREVVKADLLALFCANLDPILAALEREEALSVDLRARTDFMERRGYRRCDIAACNCGSWHQGHAETRLREIADALGERMQGKTILGVIEELVEHADKPTPSRALVEAMREEIEATRPVLAIVSNGGYLDSRICSDLPGCAEYQRRMERIHAARFATDAAKERA